MRIHTDAVTEQDIREAARFAGVSIVNLSRHGSRSRHHALEVTFSGSSKYGGQYGGLDYSAATWDEWGIVLGVLFDRDPRMIAGGPNGYVGAIDYHWQTGHRFSRNEAEPGGAADVVTPATQHRRHRWEYSGETVTSTYHVSQCRCGAVSRRLARGVTREEMGLGVPERVNA